MIGFIGNAIAVYVINKPRVEKSAQYKLIGNLAIADMLTSILNMPSLLIYIIFNGNLVFGSRDTFEVFVCQH